MRNRSTHTCIVHNIYVLRVPRIRIHDNVVAGEFVFVHKVMANLNTSIHYQEILFGRIFRRESQAYSVLDTKKLNSRTKLKNVFEKLQRITAVRHFNLLPRSSIDNPVHIERFSQFFRLPAVVLQGQDGFFQTSMKESRSRKIE